MVDGSDMCDSNIAVKDCFKVAKEASPSWNSFQAVSALFYKAAVQEALLSTHQRICSTGSSQGCRLSLCCGCTQPQAFCVSPIECYWSASGKRFQGSQPHPSYSCLSPPTPNPHPKGTTVLSEPSPDFKAAQSPTLWKPCRKLGGGRQSFKRDHIQFY